MVVISNYIFVPSVSSLLDVQRNDDIVSAITKEARCIR